MKSETQVRKELEQLEDDLKYWRQKYDRVNLSLPDGITRRMMVGNTISGVEGRIEALQWVLKEPQ